MANQITTRGRWRKRKKSRCLCSSLRRTQDLRRSWRTERTPGLQRAPLAQLMLHIRGLETKTLRGATWRFTQAISRPLNPLTVIKLALTMSSFPEPAPSLLSLLLETDIQELTDCSLCSPCWLHLNSLSLLKPSRHLSHRLGHLLTTLRPSITSNEALSPT